MRSNCASCGKHEYHSDWRRFDYLLAGWTELHGYHTPTSCVFTVWLCPDCRPDVKVSIAEQKTLFEEAS